VCHESTWHSCACLLFFASRHVSVLLLPPPPPDTRPKVSEQADELAKTAAATVVGTPNRLLKLLEEGALSLAACKLVVLDASHADAKTFTLLTLPAVAADLALLFHAAVLPALALQRSSGLADADRLRVAFV